jgi:RNA:NAD 2'-phosphotransferase (TPT1/KptA family)
MATMFHATSQKNLGSILKNGLLAAKSRQKRKAVWFVPKSGFAWACTHAVKRSGGRIEDVVVLAVDVPRGWLRKHGQGLWYCDRDVPASRISGITVYKTVEVR